MTAGPANILFPPLLSKTGRSGRYAGMTLGIGVRLTCEPAPDARDHHGGVLPYLLLDGQVQEAWVEGAGAPTRPGVAATVGNAQLRAGLSQSEQRALQGALLAVWDSREGQALMNMLAERDDAAAEQDPRRAWDGPVRLAALHAQNMPHGRALVRLWPEEGPGRLWRLCLRVPVVTLDEVTDAELLTARGAYLGWTCRNGGLYELTQANAQRLVETQRLRTLREALRARQENPPAAEHPWLNVRNAAPAPSGRGRA